MLDIKTTPLATVSPGTPGSLQDGYFVKFSDAWPATFGGVTYQDKGNVTRGSLLQVGPVNPVPHKLPPYRLAAGDFRDVDFSNVLSTFNENLYPTNSRTLYETVIAFKKANFLAHIYIPAGEYQKRLEQASMAPNLAGLRYLGALTYRDSPSYDPRFYFYSIKDLEPFILRLFVDTGVDWDKIVIPLTVNKCFMTELPVPAPPPSSDPTAQAAYSKALQYYNAALARAKIIRYYSELRW